LALVLDRHTDLKELVEAWPDLPESIKAAIKALIQTHKAEQQTGGGQS
jgi:hypothetical protein